MPDHRVNSHHAGAVTGRVWLLDEATANTDPEADTTCTRIIMSQASTVISILHKLDVCLLTCHGHVHLKLMLTRQKLC